MFPRGIPSAALPVAVTSALRTCSSRASRKLGSLSLASSDHLTPHGQAGGGSRPPGSAPLHRRPPRPPPPTAKKLRAPACGIVFRASHHASGPQDSRRDAARKRFGCVVRVVHIARSRGHLRALTASSDVLVTPGASALLSSFVQLGHSCGIT